MRIAHRSSRSPTIPARPSEAPGERWPETNLALDERRSADSTGSGLGLYRARRLAAEHDGELTVEPSGTGQGAVLLLRLPRTSVDLSGDDCTAGHLAPEAVAT